MTHRFNILASQMFHITYRASFMGKATIKSPHPCRNDWPQATPLKLLSSGSSLNQIARICGLEDHPLQVITQCLTSTAGAVSFSTHLTSPHSLIAVGFTGVSRRLSLSYAPNGCATMDNASFYRTAPNMLSSCSSGGR